MAIPIDKVAGSIELLKEPSAGGRLLRLPASASPACTANCDEVAVGSSITLSCSGFKSGEIIKLWWNKVAGNPYATDIAGLRGMSKMVITAPEANEGVHHLIIKGAVSGARITVNMKIVPSIPVAAASVAVGKGVNVNISGLKAEESVSIVLAPLDGSDMHTVRRFTTSIFGSFTGRMVIPPIEPGEYLVRVRRSSGKGPKTVLNVLAK